MKKYIVTDPCYLMHIKENKDLWEKFCDLWYSGKEEQGENLIKEHLGINYLTIASTGFGDWCNSIYSYTSKCNIIKSDFGADAGLVCVCEYTEEMEKAKIDGAIFETERLKDVTFDESDHDWTVVIIETKEGTIHSDEDINYDDCY